MSHDTILELDNINKSFRGLKAIVEGVHEVLVVEY